MNDEFYLSSDSFIIIWSTMIPTSPICTKSPSEWPVITISFVVSFHTNLHVQFDCIDSLLSVSLIWWAFHSQESGLTCEWGFQLWRMEWTGDLTNRGSWQIRSSERFSCGGMKRRRNSGCNLNPDFALLYWIQFARLVHQTFGVSLKSGECEPKVSLAAKKQSNQIF
jgi:hypothetical protein